MTFRQHVEVLARRRRQELPRQFFEIPVFYFTNPRALIGAHDPVPVPPGCQWLDFECEIGAVIGREGHNLSPEQAWDHVVGYCLFNDWSARDVQANEMEMRLGPAKGSTGDVFGSGTCGYGCLAELRVYDAEKYPWLSVGDEVTCEVERLGRIANRVVAGAEARPGFPGARRAPGGLGAPFEAPHLY